MLLNGIDISNYSGKITPGSFAAARANRNLSFVICGTQVPEITRYQIDSAKSAGLDVELYTYLYYDYHDDERIAKAIEIAQQFGLTRIWIDVETSEQYPPGDEPMRDVIVRSAATIINANINCGIYTNGRYWNEMTAEWTAFENFPLFIASWVFSRDITENDFINYAEEWPVFGGWTRPHTWQFAADVNLPGNVHCDLCVRYVADVEQPPVPEVPGLPVDESQEWYNESLLTAHALNVGYLAYYKQEWSNIHPVDAEKLYNFSRWVVRNYEAQ